MQITKSLSLMLSSPPGEKKNSTFVFAKVQTGMQRCKRESLANKQHGHLKKLLMYGMLMWLSLYGLLIINTTWYVTWSRYTKKSIFLYYRRVIFCTLLNSMSVVKSFTRSRTIHGFFSPPNLYASDSRFSETY